MDNNEQRTDYARTLEKSVANLTAENAKLKAELEAARITLDRYLSPKEVRELVGPVINYLDTLCYRGTLVKYDQAQHCKRVLESLGKEDRK